MAIDPAKYIYIEGARVHNLQNVSVAVPRYALVVVTGVSGSGKSSLVVDCLFAEGQRRYAESLSAYARQFFSRMQKPEVDTIEGLSPAICVGAKSGGDSSRSTVGTSSEVYDYLRLLYAKIGRIYCPTSGEEVKKYTPDQVVLSIRQTQKQGGFFVTFPLAISTKQQYTEELTTFLDQGLSRVLVDHTPVRIDDILSRPTPTPCELIVAQSSLTDLDDDLSASELSNAIAYAFEQSPGAVYVHFADNTTQAFSQQLQINGVVFTEPTANTFSFNSPLGACPFCKGIGKQRGSICKHCGGSRLNEQSSYVKINGTTIGELLLSTCETVYNWIQQLSLTDTEQHICQHILTELTNRLQTMLQVGLGYLTLNRSQQSLSGGEAQRVKLSLCLGSNLSDSIYILDEPSTGLHDKDIQHLVNVLGKLRDLGNTVIVIEHDDQIMRAADHIIDLGPLASHLGGQICAQGTYEAICAHPQSLTGKYLREGFRPLRKHVRTVKHFLKLQNAYENNLQNIDVHIPLGVICVVCGRSGSGKSSLIRHTLFPALRQKLEYVVAYSRSIKLGSIDADWSQIDAVEMIDQQPIGRQSRSNPLSYIGGFDSVRALFAQLPESKTLGLTPSHFSYNEPGGRCEHCEGLGEEIIDMQLLADIHLPCAFCRGKRYKETVLSVRYNGKNIYDVLQLSVDEAIAFFAHKPNINRFLHTLQEVGLGYMKLGQSSATLSGGEAQRVKLATFLHANRSGPKKLLLFDEPTTGLHFQDIEKLLLIFDKLVTQGHSILIVEHHQMVIKNADWIIEMGPGAGEKGGRITYTGVPTGRPTHTTHAEHVTTKKLPYSE